MIGFSKFWWTVWTLLRGIWIVEPHDVANKQASKFHCTCVDTFLWSSRRLGLVLSFPEISKSDLRCLILFQHGTFQEPPGWLVHSTSPACGVTCYQKIFNYCQAGSSAKGWDWPWFMEVISLGICSGKCEDKNGEFNESSCLILSSPSCYRELGGSWHGLPLRRYNCDFLSTINCCRQSIWTNWPMIFSFHCYGRLS